MGGEIDKSVTEIRLHYGTLPYVVWLPAIVAYSNYLSLGEHMILKTPFNIFIFRYSRISFALLLKPSTWLIARLMLYPLNATIELQALLIPGLLPNHLAI